MKAIVCEMCESTNVVKQDGFYVCQDCGTRYTTEDAKKLMKEIGGGIETGNKTVAQKHLQNARRAMGKEDWEEVEKYYNLVEENDPDNIEAVFYSAYGKAMQSLRDDDIYKRQSVFKTLTRSTEIIGENFDVEKVAEQKELIEKITTDTIKLFGSSFVYTQTKNGYGNVTGDNKSETYSLFNKLCLALDNALKALYAKIPANEKANAAYMLKARLKLTDYAINDGHYSSEAKDAWAKDGDAIVAELKKYDSSVSGKNYTALREAQKAEEAENAKKGAIGCLVVVVVGVILGLIIFFAMTN